MSTFYDLCDLPVKNNGEHIVFQTTTQKDFVVWGFPIHKDAEGIWKDTTEKVFFKDIVYIVNGTLRLPPLIPKDRRGGV